VTRWPSRRAALRIVRVGIGRVAPAVAAVLAILAVGLGAPSARADGDDAETRKTMAQVYDAMKYLLPLSFEEARFADPARQDKIRAALAKLAESSGRLESHAGEHDAAFSYLSRSMANDARDIRERFEQGHVLEARFLVQTLAETCVACHSRLPADRDVLRGDNFVDSKALAELPLASRAKVAYATHRFERALELYEQLFASPDASPNDFDLDGAIDDYLELCIRVRRDLQRPDATLARLAKRRDLTDRLRGEIAHWRASLEELQKRKRSDGTLIEARRLVAKAENPQRFGDEREALVVYLEASGILHRAVAKGDLEGTDLAEAYYLLGLIETRIGRSFWLSQAEAFLETAIRTAPGTRVAEQAYAVLEDFLIAGFSGSGGTDVPPDVAAKLDELLVLASRPPPPKSAQPSQSQ